MWGTRPQNQKKKLAGISSYALTIKLIDRLHNILDHPKPEYVHDTVGLLWKLDRERKLTKTQKRILSDILLGCRCLLKSYLKSEPKD